MLKSRIGVENFGKAESDILPPTPQPWKLGAYYEHLPENTYN